MKERQQRAVKVLNNLLNDRHLSEEIYFLLLEYVMAPESDTRTLNYTADKENQTTTTPC